jgi:hypothetical protein
MKVIEINLNELILDPKNARKHDDKNIRMIAASLKEFGQQKLPVINKDKIIIAGNGTVIAARSLNWQKMYVVETELNDEKAFAFSIADNQIAGTSSWDLELLGLNLKEIKNDSWLNDWNAIGFERDELNLFLTAEWKEPVDDGMKSSIDEGSKDEKPKSIKVTKEQLEIFNLAAARIRESENDSTIMDGRIVEYLSAEYLSG